MSQVKIKRLYQQLYNSILLLPLAPREEEEDVQLLPLAPREEEEDVQLAGFCAGPDWPAGLFMGNIRNAFPLIVKFKYVHLHISENSCKTTNTHPP
jgi:hypothetical protein